MVENRETRTEGNQLDLVVLHLQFSCSWCMSALFASFAPNFELLSLFFSLSHEVDNSEEDTALWPVSSSQGKDCVESLSKVDWFSTITDVVVSVHAKILVANYRSHTEQIVPLVKLENQYRLCAGQFDKLPCRF